MKYSIAISSSIILKAIKQVISDANTCLNEFITVVFRTGTVLTQNLEFISPASTWSGKVFK